MLRQSVCDSLEGMKNLIHERYVARRQLVPVLALCLVAYFGYHLVAGERSYLRLVSLNYQIAKTEKELQVETGNRVRLEERVAMMRPGSVDRDLLEEQARKILGLRYKDEKVLIKN